LTSVSTETDFVTKTYLSTVLQPTTYLSTVVSTQIYDKVRLCFVAIVGTLLILLHDRQRLLRKHRSKPWSTQ
jgi:hypothetical protein